MTNSVPLVALLLFGALVAILVFSVIARRLRVPYPVIFVLGGTALAFIPHAPQIHIKPQWIFLIVLPPLLFSGGWSTDLASFRRNLRTIALLAIGLVLVTTFLVGGIARLVIHGIPWAAAFTLGAIVAPPDPVAAETVMEQLVVSQRIATIVSAEGLMNDAVSLVLFTVATGAMVNGHFSLPAAVGDFFGETAGGIALGVAVAFLIEGIHRLLARTESGSTLVSSVALLIAPYASYLPADAAHVSGVLAAVSAGITLGYRSPYIYSAETRVMSRHFWDMLTLLINGAVFLLIGFELRGVFQKITQGPKDLLVAAAAILGTLIAVRILWVFLVAYLPRIRRAMRKELDALPSWRAVALVAWAGMRGIVSLGAALSIPLTTAKGHGFPFRSEIVFLTFCVIFVTLVAQGFTLRPLVERWNLSQRDEREKLETEIRIRALQKGLERLRELSRTSDGAREYAERLRRQYERRIAHLRGHLQGSEEQSERRTEEEHRVEREALDAEVKEIMHLRSHGEIPDAVYRDIQYDLDLAIVRLH